MKPVNKNSPFKSVVEQLKTRISAPDINRPAAPAVYRPQPVPRVLQAKMHCRPQPATNSLKPATVQYKAISPVRKPPTAPPVYRPEQKRVAPALVGRSLTNSVAQPKAFAIQRHIGSRSVVQRAEYRHLNAEGLLPQDTEDLTGFAQQFNRAYTGQPESRHTQAVTVDENDRMMMFTQRWMSQMEDVVLPDPIELKDNDIWIGDQEDDENIHAEMLAISCYLTGDAEMPKHMGVSKPVCARCSVVLNYFRIAHYSDGSITKNWTSPWRHANQYPPLALKGRIPEIVRKGVVHDYKDSDFR